MLHAADGILINENGKIVLIRRKGVTYYDYWALPGGTVDEGETIEEALIREMKEETGVDVELQEILGIFSDPDRDPRGRVISTVFICKYIGKLKAGSDAGSLTLCTVEEALKINLAFDHNFILQCYQQWLEQKGTFWSKKKLQN